MQDSIVQERVLLFSQGNPLLQFQMLVRPGIVIFSIMHTLYLFYFFSKWSYGL